MIVEYLTDTAGAWSSGCRHELEEETGFQVDQLGLSFVDQPADSAIYHVARCVRCGEWVTLTNRQEILI